MRCKVCGKFYLFRHRCEIVRERYISEMNRYNSRIDDPGIADPTNLILTAALINNLSSDNPQEPEQKNESLDDKNLWPHLEPEQKNESFHSEVDNENLKTVIDHDPEPVRTEPSFSSEPSFTSEPSYDSSPDFGSSDCGSCDSGGGGSD